MKDRQGAIRDYSKFIEIYELKYIKVAAGAIRDENKFIKLKPNYAEAYSGRGLLKFELGDKQGACQDWSKAGELGLMKAYDKIKQNCN